jgi:maltose alpha-D-glucosyltransferase/alpha-amylase
MSNRWYKQAVIYSLEVDTYQDSDGDGCGDFQGLISRLDYLSRLGVTCLWLNPIHPSPDRDDASRWRARAHFSHRVSGGNTVPSG